MSQNKKRPGIKTEWGTLRPAMSKDTFRGKPIKSGTIAFGYHMGTVKTNDGQEIGITASGACLVLSCNGREFSLDTNRFIEEGIKAGLTKRKINFTEEV